MSPLEDPSISELIRTLSTKMDHVSAQIVGLQAQLGQYVTQEQRQADQALSDLQRLELQKDVDEIRDRVKAQEDRAQQNRRVVWSAGALPFIVGFIFWVLTTTVGGVR